MFCSLFHEHHAKLHRYAHTILRSNEAAEDIVQTAFLALWEKKEGLLGQEGIGAYLYKSVYTRCLNALRDKKTRAVHIREVAVRAGHAVDNANDRVLAGEVSARVRTAFERLPPQCKIVFIKSREEGLRYAEIAEALGISVKTVEAQIGKALKIFREELKDFL